MSVSLTVAAGAPVYQSLGLSGLQLPVNVPPTITSGSLPPGIGPTLDGYLTGQCLTAGTYTFSVSYTDVRNTNQVISGNSVTIDADAALTVTGNNSPYSLGSAVSITITRTGGIAGGTFAIVNGQRELTRLGLTLNTSTGVLSGTPTSVTPSVESLPQITISYTDANNMVSLVDFFIQVHYATLAVSCPTPGGTHNVAYSTTATATGGKGPYTYSVYSGSTGALTLNAASGVLSGTVTSAGTVGPFVIQALDQTLGTTAVTGSLSITFS